jgi:hypothetical protein
MAAVAKSSEEPAHLSGVAMETAELIEWCRQEAARRGWVEYPEELLQRLQPEQAEAIAAALRRTTLMRLPEAEIRFFEWLRQADPPVWQDLWGDPDAEPYIVGISFLPQLVREPQRGFPICDLQTVDNYYFTPAHITPVEGRLFLEMAQEALLKGEPLTLAQRLLLEISLGAVDIWHLAYHRGWSLEELKAAVAELAEAKVLIHLRRAEELADYVE